jgi:pSer/pThr/pTyr-binding forkhead associated (FHA) protein
MQVASVLLPPYACRVVGTGGTLVVTQGALAGQRLELEGELVIGREGVAVTIDDPELSRRHAAVRPIEGGFEVEDLGSLNGTFVNGRRIEGPTKLSSGDKVKLGQNVLELEARASATVASPAFTPGLAPATAAPPPSAPAAPGINAAPAEPFGTYAVPRTKRRRGIASRQWGPMLASWVVVAGTAAALAIYFANH